MINTFILNLPPQLNIIMLENNKIKKLTIYIYNENYFIKLCFNYNIYEHTFRFDKECNYLELNKNLLKINHIYNINYLNKFFLSLNIYFFYKIKFKGKGYRIRYFKKHKTMKFFFGKSHMTILKFKKLILKKIGKYKFIIKNLNLNNLKKETINIINIKKINVYTLRGLRTSRQIIFKRKGKKSTYI